MIGIVEGIPECFPKRDRSFGFNKMSASRIPPIDSPLEQGFRNFPSRWGNALRKPGRGSRKDLTESPPSPPESHHFVRQSVTHRL